MKEILANHKQLIQIWWKMMKDKLHQLEMHISLQLQLAMTARVLIWLLLLVPLTSFHAGPCQVTKLPTLINPLTTCKCTPGAQFVSNWPSKSPFGGYSCDDRSPQDSEIVGYSRPFTSCAIPVWTPCQNFWWQLFGGNLRPGLLGWVICWTFAS